MANITLAQAQAIVSGALAYSREHNFVNPMAVIVLDARAVPKTYAVEDDSALRRWDFAFGKAYGALAMSVGSKTLSARAAANPQSRSKIIFSFCRAFAASAALMPTEGMPVRFG